jgi:pyridinium-3,5-bisthiocarboxylic acid mononucleotide nickel chelatase
MAIDLRCCGDGSIQSTLSRSNRPRRPRRFDLMRIAYFDCIAGITGDTALAALLDTGVDVDHVKSHLSTLPLEPFDLAVEEVEEHGIRATRVGVRADSVAGVIRTYASIRALIDAADIPPEARRLTHRMFRLFAEADARVHRREPETVTFHEAAGVDALVDLVGVAVALTTLEVQRVFSSAVPTGLGMTKTEHGAMPIPTPTVVELLRGAPMFSLGIASELTTATGAAILAATVEGYGELPTMRVEAAGYGAGAQRLEIPNLLRVLIGEQEPAASRPSVAGTPDLRLVTESGPALEPEDAG